MADKHAYISAAGPLVQTIEQLRKSYPGSVTSETLKKLGLAPGNESFAINILKFLKLLGEDGARTAQAQATFSKHSDADFHTAFEKHVRDAYKDLFELHGDAAWSLPTDKLISYFRNSDQTSDLVGKRQAMTFQTLASFAGHEAAVKSKASAKTNGAAKATKPAKKTTKAAKTATTSAASDNDDSGSGSPGIGLTVRIEINLPAQGDQDTYDRIFSSLRTNLLNGK